MLWQQIQKHQIMQKKLYNTLFHRVKAVLRILQLQKILIWRKMIRRLIWPAARKL